MYSVKFEFLNFLVTMKFSPSLPTVLPGGPFDSTTARCLLTMPTGFEAQAFGNKEL
jgi:hypothetical protein